MGYIKLITNKQINLIKKIKNFYKEYSENKINNFDSSISFFSTYNQESPGYGVLKYWINKKNIYLLLKIFVKNFLLSFYFSKLYIKENTKKKFYNKIIISWSNIEDFNENGSYNDKYFNTNSNVKKNILWFLIHLDKKIPKKINSNIIVLYQKKKHIQMAKLLKFIIQIKYNFINFRKIIDKNSILTTFGVNLTKKFKYYLNKNLKEILIPYEGQPFQNMLLEFCKNYNSNIKTTGYIHSFPPALPANLFFRQGSPKKLIVNSFDQKRFFSNFIGWDKKNVYILDSARFDKNKRDMSNCIFLPINFSSSEFIIKQLHIIANKNILNSNYIIKNHPKCLNSKNHLNLIKKINILKKKYIANNSNYNIKKYSIFIGATSSVIEALERGVNVIHIVNEPILETYNPKFWPNIKVNCLNKFIYKYSLIKKESLIKFGSKEKSFNKYLSI
jgi:hypothetical protein